MRRADLLRALQGLASHEDGCAMFDCGCCCTCASAERIVVVADEIEALAKDDEQ